MLNIDFFDIKNKRYDGEVPTFDEFNRSCKNNDIIKSLLPFMHKIFLFTFQQDLAGINKRRRGEDPKPHREAILNAEKASFLKNFGMPSNYGTLIT